MSEEGVSFGDTANTYQVAPNNPRRKIISNNRNNNSIAMTQMENLCEFSAPFTSAILQHVRADMTSLKMTLTTSNAPRVNKIVDNMLPLYGQSDRPRNPKQKTRLL